MPNQEFVAYWQTRATGASMPFKYRDKECPNNRTILSNSLCLYVIFLEYSSDLDISSESEYDSDQGSAVGSNRAKD